MTKTDTVSDKIYHLLQQHFYVDLDQITPATHIVNDLYADSLDIVELTMDLEEDFDIDIPDDDVEKLQETGTVEALVDYVKDRL